MPRQIYINLPVKNLNKSTEFYSALGFQLNPQFSDENASSMMWTEDIVIMLLTHEFYSKFVKKPITDTNQYSSSILALTLESVEEVQQFADIAKENGGDYFEAEINQDSDFMFCLEITDPDGHQLEAFFMDVTKFPEEDVD